MDVHPRGSVTMWAAEDSASTPPVPAVLINEGKI